MMNPIAHEILKTVEGGSIPPAALNKAISRKFRVAIDAVGLAVLKVIGSNPAIMHRKIFEQEQIARAVELGLGASSPLEIEVLSVDEESQEYCDQVIKILMEG